ncbi:hypothetical protein L1987_03507 [Smallanthus sonchifolius]|uniref:Uncharacterized protein n=1 Tax=Smallanthus sonchifolius TaxID=185202 RepID=A0ACB9KAV6_9ASTR|nr:hypothetical protein L1987_03507 [Smallanthus sonchifolius]
MLCLNLNTSQIVGGGGVRMMSATIRRKALALCSSALTNNGIVQSLKRAPPALAGSASRGYVAGNPMFEGIVQSLERAPPALVGSASRGYVAGNLTFEEFGKRSKLVPEPLRDVSLFETDFSTHKWIRSFSTFSEPAKIEKIVNTSVKRTHNGSAYFTSSGAVVGSVLSTPIVNAPQATKLGLSSTVSSTFLPNLALFWHINNGIEEILADYVHHEMTRSLILVLMRLFLIVAAKDVFVATN